MSSLAEELQWEISRCYPGATLHDRLSRAIAVVQEIERAPDDDEEHPDKRLLRHMRWRDRLVEMVK